MTGVCHPFNTRKPTTTGEREEGGGEVGKRMKILLLKFTTNFYLLFSWPSAIASGGNGFICGCNLKIVHRLALIRIVIRQRT